MQGFVVAASQKRGKGRNKGQSLSSTRRSQARQKADDQASSAPSKVALFPRLDVLDLRDNDLRDIRGLEVLGPKYCPDLSELSLSGNPVCDKINYEANVVKRIPTLALLDGRSPSNSAPDIMSLDGTEVTDTTGSSKSRPTTATRPGSATRRAPPSPRGFVQRYAGTLCLGSSQSVLATCIVHLVTVVRTPIP